MAGRPAEQTNSTRFTANASVIIPTDLGHVFKIFVFSTILVLVEIFSKRTHYENH